MTEACYGLYIHALMAYIIGTLHLGNAIRKEESYDKPYQRHPHRRELHNAGY